MGCYDDIRPYNDDEINHYVNLLLNDSAFLKVLSSIYEGDNEKLNQSINLLSKFNTRHDFQHNFIGPLIKSWIIKRTTNGLTHNGLDKLDKSKGYIFISNHRDIILDSAIMNFLMINENRDTTEIAIGDNLLIYDWIHYLAKMNGAFEVKRNLPGREFFLASKNMSSYIRERITEHNISVWIAQREGRTKNGNDQTQVALIKMLGMSNDKDFVAGFNELNIVPLSISYEREPCGISKVEELYKKETEGFVKTQKDDLMSMVFGLTRPKGRVHFSFGEPLDVKEIIGESSNANENLRLIAESIDNQIYNNYKLFPFNYLAADMLSGNDKYKHEVDNASREKFNEMLNDLVETIGAGDAKRQQQLFLEMYAAPLFNKNKVANGSL